MGRSGVLFCALAVLATSFGQVIETKLGSLKGEFRTSRDGRKYTSWTKIPYAKPPVGPLRLANPEPYGKWDGELDATQAVPICIQGKLFGFGVVGVGQEDCLYLNVYKPDVDAKSLPVLFFIHGGGFVFGHPGGPDLAEFIMDENVILVAITYRLGVLGFMSLHDNELPGNFGLKDQALALKWVYENIDAFGGDPKAITVFGDSAGGASAHFMFAYPQTKDMVAGAYLISGVVQKVWAPLSPEVVKSTTETLVETLNCNKATTHEILKCLRSIEEASTIAIAMSNVYVEDEETIVIGPTIEPPGPEAFVSEYLSENNTSTKPLMLTYAAGEYLLFEFADRYHNLGNTKRIQNDKNSYTWNIAKKFHSDQTELAAAAKILQEHYLKNDDDLLREWSMIRGDLDFTYPTLELADSHKGPVWIYQMVHRGDISYLDITGFKNLKIASHAEQIFYLINFRDRYPVEPRMDETGERISKLMVKHLANFASYGNPTPDGSLAVWERYAGKEFYKITTEGFALGDDNFIEEQEDVKRLWRTILNHSPMGR